ncbi:hypothetical protein ABIE44_002153 [Marmoricola sp. OAE513]|uniref:hypothetical protein n=1 Tax=Marmoricola sp. OAE513 TaxID=2817894 RepID=UPI001AE38415
MRSKLISALTVIGAVTVLVLAANTVALAATGSSLLAGKTTSAGKTTTLKRTTPGTALKLKTKKSTDAPLAVTGRGRVANLNADLVDGLDSGALRNRTYEFTSTAFTGKKGVRFTLPLPNGAFTVSYSQFFTQLNATSGIQCYIEQDTVSGPGSDLKVGYSSFIYTANPEWRPAMTGSGVVTKTPNTKITVTCESNNGTFSRGDFRITATETKLVSTKALTPVDADVF